MTKITVVGSSHIAALRSGWELISQEFPDLELTFFGAPHRALAHARIDKALRYGLLQPTAEASKHWAMVKKMFGTCVVDLSAADAVIYCGANMGEQSNARLLAQASVDGLHPVEGRRRMSRESYDAACDHIIEEALKAWAFRDWKKPNLYVIPKPRVSESIVTSTAEIDRPWVTLATDPTLLPEVLSAFYGRLAQRLAKSGIRFIEPPPQVLGPNGLTRSLYCQGSRRLLNDQEHPTDDFAHMNAQYGAIVLGNTLRSVPVTTR